jgi:hypothetical protein
MGWLFDTVRPDPVEGTNGAQDSPAERQTTGLQVFPLFSSWMWFICGKYG